MTSSRSRRTASHGSGSVGGCSGSRARTSPGAIVGATGRCSMPSTWSAIQSISSWPRARNSAASTGLPAPRPARPRRALRLRRTITTIRQPMNAIASATTTNMSAWRQPPWALLPHPGWGLALTQSVRSLSCGRNGLSVTGGAVGGGVALGHDGGRRTGRGGSRGCRRHRRQRDQQRRHHEHEASCGRWHRAGFYQRQLRSSALTVNTADAAPAPSHQHAVLVVDFGAQYAQLIARRVRELSVYSEIVPNRITAAEVAARRPAALILSGGPKSVHVDGAPSLDPAIYELGVPILGICYGAQLIAQQLGGTVGRGMRGEYGRAKLRRTGPSLLFPDDAPDVHDVWMSHFDAITDAPGRVHGDGRDRRRPRRRARGRRPAHLRRAVPPRGRPLAVRHGRAAPLPARAGGGAGRLDDGVGHRRAGRARSGPRSATAA